MIIPILPMSILIPMSILRSIDTYDCPENYTYDHSETFYGHP
jgi:hypothetical protein